MLFYIYSKLIIFIHFFITLMPRTKGAKNKVGVEKGSKRIQLQASIYRLNISYLTGYGTFQILGKDTKRMIGRCPELDSLKSQVLQRLIFYQKHRGLKYYSIAWQTHQSTGEPHLDILITYDKNIIKSLSSFNYLLELCSQRTSETTPGVFITPYPKTRLNKAIFQYGSKEDPSVISNFPEDTSSILQTYQFQKDPYTYLQNQMRKDPLHFNLEQYASINNLYKYISNWSSIKSKLKDSQTATANRLLKNKPGFKYISQHLIESVLDSNELERFYSWEGYQIIVNYLNQIVTYSYKRPLKTMNLLITGNPNIGKTSFIQKDFNDTHNCIERYCSLYPMSSKTWWPNYKSETYQLISWNQTKLTAYSYDVILKVLEGSKVDLPQKGTSTLKYDNPLVLMTSNMTLDQMIKQKFGYSQDLMDMARQNLAVRIQNVIVPKGYDLFLLQKLLIPA